MGKCVTSVLNLICEMKRLLHNFIRQHIVQKEIVQKAERRQVVYFSCKKKKENLSAEDHIMKTDKKNRMRYYRETTNKRVCGK